MPAPPAGLDEVARSVCGQWAALGQEQSFKVRVAVRASNAEIAVEGADGSRAEVDGAGLAALAGDVGDVVFEVEVVNVQRARFGDT